MFSNKLQVSEVELNGCAHHVVLTADLLI